MFVKIKLPISEEEFVFYETKARDVHPEWVTVVTFAFWDGIPSRVTRQLKRTSIAESCVRFILCDKGNTWPIKRRLSERGLKHYLTLPSSEEYLCRRLHNLDNNSLRRERHAIFGANTRVTETSILWWYREAHKSEAEKEKIMARLEKLAYEFLTAEEIRHLEGQIVEWNRLAPTQNRGRRRTRAEILGRAA